jgi:hypothetical protein
MSPAGFGDKFKVKRNGVGESDERETLHYARTVIRPGDRILYIHSKGVSDARWLLRTFTPTAFLTQCDRPVHSFHGLA